MLAIPFILGVTIIVAKIYDSNEVYLYKRHLFYTKDHLQLDFKELIPMSVAELKAKFPIDWICIKDPTQFGDSNCSDELKHWNGLTAMLAVFWFDKGKLKNAKINVPPWSHGELIDYLLRTYGEPTSYTSDRNLPNLIRTLEEIAQGTSRKEIPEKIRDRGIWHLASGAWLMVNLKKNSNPFDWSTVFWMSPDTIGEIKKKANTGEYTR